MLSLTMFHAGEVVTSGRVRLSTLTPEAAEVLATWTPSALAPEWQPDVLGEPIRSGRGVLISDASSTRIGLAIVHLDSPDAGKATIPFLAIEPARRFRGLGGEAGIALERHLRQRLGLTRFYVPAPEGRGLAVYFWLRLGYRPLVTEDTPKGLAGLTPDARPGIWLVRDEA